MQLSKTDILSAIKNNNFIVHLQQKMDLDGNLTGAESLARLNIDGIDYPPYEFIPILEDNPRLMHEFTKSIFLSSLEALTSLKNNGFTGKLSFNVSAIDLQNDNDIAPFVISHTPPDLIDNLEVEITESMPILPIDEQHTIHQVKMLSDAGISIAIDDVGENNSFGFLIFETLYPYVNTIKIDKSVTDNFVENTDELYSIINYANNLTDSTPNIVIEGVEPSDDGNKALDILNKSDIANQLSVQGYIHGSPVPIDNFNKSFIVHTSDSNLTDSVSLNIG